MDTEAEAQPGLRERKKQRTRRRLAEAAAERFDRDGFETTTIEAIAESVEVSKRTFFRYYPSKEAAAIAPELEFWEAVQSRLADPPADGTVIDLVESAITDSLASMAPGWEDRLFKCRALLSHNPTVQAESLRAADEAQRRTAKHLGPLIGVDDNAPELRLAIEIGFAAWRTAARLWVSGRKRDRKGDLLATVERAFAAIPGGLELSARD